MKINRRAKFLIKLDLALFIFLIQDKNTNKG